MVYHITKSTYESKLLIVGLLSISIGRLQIVILTPNLVQINDLPCSLIWDLGHLGIHYLLSKFWQNSKLRPTSSSYAVLPLVQTLKRRNQVRCIKQSLENIHPPFQNGVWTTLLDFSLCFKKKFYNITKHKYIYWHVSNLVYFGVKRYWLQLQHPPPILLILPPWNILVKNQEVNCAKFSNFDHLCSQIL